MKTKGGKAMNPTDAYRKELRKKELKRNKKERKKVREVGILKKDPEAIREQIKKLDAINTDDGALDKTRRHQKRKLEETLNLVLKKRKEYADKAKDGGEEQVMFSHLPSHQQQRAEASLSTSQMQPALNPLAVPGIPYTNNVIIPPPPPLPKLSALSVPVPPPPPPPLSVPVPPPPPAPLSVPVPPPPPPPSQPPARALSEPPPPAVTGESSSSVANEAHKSDSENSDQSESDSQSDSDNDEDDDNEGAPPVMPQVLMQRAPAPPPPPPLPPPPQVPPPLQVMRPPFPPHGLVAMPMVPPPLVPVPPPHMFTMPYGLPPAPPRLQTEPPQALRADKPFYVKSAAPTATKRPLAQHTPALTSMVPASVRVRRENAPKPLKPRAVATPVRPPEPASKPPSIDESYSAFLEDMKALGAFDV